MKQDLPSTFIVQVFREGRMYVSYNPELRVSSCGHTVAEAKRNIQDALLGFIDAARRAGTLADVLEDAGYVRTARGWAQPEPVQVARVSLAA